MDFTALALFGFTNVFRLTSYTSASSPVALKIQRLRSSSPFAKPSAAVVTAALEWARQLTASGFSDVDAFPGHDGEILISGLQNEECFEVTIEPDLMNSVSFEKRGRQIFFLDRVSVEEATKKLVEAVQDRWISSVGYIQTNSINASTGSLASPSKTRLVLTEVSP